MDEKTSVAKLSTASPAASDSKTQTRKPARLIEHLFAKFAAIYGVKFADQWAGIDLAAVKATWTESLAGLARDEIVAGIQGLVESGKPFPPTLPEFYRSEERRVGKEC